MVNMDEIPLLDLIFFGNTALRGGRMGFFVSLA